MSNPTGYGPANSRLYFDGNRDNYDLWEVKFLGHLRLRKLLQVVEGAPAAVDASKNAEVFAELIQLLDDKSLKLIFRDAKDNGRQALTILREHYLGCSKPRIISLYTELTTLTMASNETATDYIIRAETAAASLKSAGETVSDALLVAMVLKGLPSEYRTFSTVITQRTTEVKFSEFKISLRNYEENEKCRASNSKTLDEDSVMKVSSDKIVCFKCNQPGHKQFECKKSKYKPKRWCDICKNKSHDTKFCRNNSASVVKECDKSFLFMTNDNIQTNDALNSNYNRILVDCGATSHIICEKSLFSKFHSNFDGTKHFIELADGSRSNDVVKGKGDARVSVHNSEGKKCDLTLQNALCIPSYNQNIFSVQAATEKGACVKFYPDNAELITPDGVKFNIEKRGKLYFLNNVRTERIHSLAVSYTHLTLPTNREV